MNSTEILHQTLAWSFYKDQEATGNSWDIASLLKALGIKTQSQLIGFELTDLGYLHSANWYENKNFFFATMKTSGKQINPSEEVHALTQVILHTLSCDADKYHDMSEIPGLEVKTWPQLSELTHYLVRQGWVEASAKDDKLYVKLTIKGSVFLRNLDLAA